MNELNNDLIKTQVTLANASELALAIVRETLGNETATVVDGVDLTNGVCLSMIQARLQKNLELHLGVNEQ